MTATRISYAYFGAEPSFATTAGLRDALLASYPGVEFFGSPIAALARGRDFDTGPAWGWLGALLRTRTDWWEAAGVGLQHAVHDGGELARIALADLLETCPESVVLVEWTGPIAKRWPDARTSGAKGLAWRDERLDAIVARQRAQWSEMEAAKLAIPGPDGDDPIDGVTTAADLEALLARRAKAGRDQPWSWLRWQLFVHPWLRTTTPAVWAKLAGGSDVELRAMLDWLAEEHDLWRYLERLEAWRQAPPEWWDEPVKLRRGRRNPLRRALVAELKTLGELALRALGGARRQVATPPVADLRAISDWSGASAPAPRERPQAPTPAVTPPMTLAFASLRDGDGFTAPTPACAFAEHHAAITRLLVLDDERVLSVDRDRVALLWDPRTAATLARYTLPAGAIDTSVFATDDGALACLAREPDALVVRALDDHRELAHVTTRGLPEISLALCTTDLSRVLIASDGELVLVSLVDGRRLARASVSNPYWEPSVLAIQAEGQSFRVRFHHVAMDMYPTDAESVFDGATLEELSREPGTIDRLAPLSPRTDASVEVFGTVARVTLADERPLPDLAAHARPICLTEWTCDEALLTADVGGAIHRWDLALGAPRTPTQHARAVMAVRFTSAGAVSFTAHDTKLWRDGTWIATLPAFTTPLIDEADRRLIDAGSTVRAYSLESGATLAVHATAPGAATVGPRGRIAVGLADAFPNRVISLRDGGERTLPPALGGILSTSAPPIVHAGRLLLTQYTAPTRSLDLDTLAVRAEQRLHVSGTCWTALHPDGVTLYSAGYADGHVGAWDFHTLAGRRRWRVFDDADPAIRAAVLLAKHDRILVAGDGRLRRVALDQGAPVDCAVAHKVEELVADDAQRRVVAFMTNAAPQVIDVESMTLVDARDGELAAASARRSVSPESAARGFDAAFVCGDGRWLVGWSRGIDVKPVALADRTLRPVFSTRQVPGYAAVRGVLVDDTREQLWVLRADGALVRTALDRDAPVEVVTTIAGGTKLSWVAPGVFVVYDNVGSLHYLRTTGERICVLERFMASPLAPHATAGSVAVCALPDGALRVAAIPGGACVTLHDARCTVAATAIVIAAPFVASLHGNRVLRWDLRTGACTGAWTSPTTFAAIDVRDDGAVLAGEASGSVTLLR